MTAVFLSGAGGRLGQVVAKTLTARGDDIVGWGDDFNYMIFAHRYRGEPSYEKEMYANVEQIRQWVNSATWAAGDKAIVIVSSVSATEPALNQSLAYNLSKAAQEQLCRYYSKTLKQVRCNSVAPATFTGTSPVCTPQQVADTIAFLCSTQASGINGQRIRVG